MRVMRRIVFPFVSFIFLLTLVCSQAKAAIFGSDRRAEVRQDSPEFQLGRSTAIAVLSSNQETTPNGLLNLLTDPLDALLCADEPFAHQPSLSYACSGFLVGPDLLVTAGHCQVNVGETRDNPDGYCKVFDWLFDYQTDSSGQVQTKNINPEHRLYHCKKTIFAVVDEKAPYRDYALIQLDRPVEGRVPLKISTAAVEKEILSMIGYPMGLPMKVSRAGKTLFSQPQARSFITNLDAFEGNSGSAVFNSKGEVVGILIGGTPSMSTVQDTTNKCSRLNRCDENGKNCLLPDLDPKKLPAGFQATGSEVERISPILDLLKLIK